MRIRTIALLALLVTLPLAAFDRGEVYFEHSSALPWSSGTYFEAWAFAPQWEYAIGADAVPLIDKLVPYLGSGHFFIAAPNEIVFHDGGTMFVWDGRYRRFDEPANGAVEIFHDDVPLGEIVPMRGGRFLVPAGAKLIAFDLHGRIAEHPFPGAEHIELLADQCTLLYGAGNRVARMNLCTDAALSDFATLAAGDVAGAIRQLPNRDVLVATGSGIAEFTADGALLRAMPFPGATHIALTPDGGAFYAAGVVAGTAVLRRYDSAPKEIPIGNPGMQSAFVPLQANDLVVVGEWRAAVQAPATVRRRAAR